MISLKKKEGRLPGGGWERTRLIFPMKEGEGKGREKVLRKSNPCAFSPCTKVGGRRKNKRGGRRVAEVYLHRPEGKKEERGGEKYRGREGRKVYSFYSYRPRPK